MHKIIKTIFILIIILSFSSAWLAAEDEMENPDIFMIKSNKVSLAETMPLEIDNFYLYSYTDYKMVSLNAYHGKVVLLEFWTTWSRHCLQEIQVLNELSEKYKKKGLEILAVVVEEKEVIKDFMKNNSNIKYNVLLGSEVMAREYNLSGLPYIYILDRTLDVRKKFSGYIDKRTLEKEIRKLL